MCPLFWQRAQDSFLARPLEVTVSLGRFLDGRVDATATTGAAAAAEGAGRVAEKALTAEAETTEEWDA
jgi:hypothetical protein